MDAKKLEILMTAVDLGSFSKASEVVGYTQSGLTHLVDSLEREISVDPPQLQRHRADGGGRKPVAGYPPVFAGKCHPGK